MHFDQFLTVAQHHHAACTSQKPYQLEHVQHKDPIDASNITEDVILAAIMAGHVKPKLTQKYLQQQLDWGVWNTSEFHQLNMYHAQEMFGTPEPAPCTGNILPFIWSYMIKLDGMRKA